MTRSTATRARPAFHIVLPLQGRAEVFTDAACEGDFVRLCVWLDGAGAGSRSPSLNSTRQV